MSWQNNHTIFKLHYLMLLLIMILAFYLAFLPHFDYPYPLHVDEWTHLACSQQIIEQAGVVGLTDPFSGGPPISNQSLEVGFHLFWAVFHQISGVPWLDIYKYFPGIIFIITILSVYVLAQRQGFGWQAAFFTCLIPTTAGILGPRFLVPVTMGLLFIPLSLFVAFNLRNWWSYVVLLIFIIFLVLLHSATAVGLLLILAPYMLLNMRGNFKHGLGIILAVAIPLLVSIVCFPWIFNIVVLPTVRSILRPHPLYGFVELPRIIIAYGYLPILLCLLGTFLLAIRGTKENYGLVLGLLALLLMLVTFFTFHYGIPMMYYRGLVYMMLMASIVAGAGLMGVKNVRLPANLTARLKVPLITQNVGNILCLILVGLTLAMYIPNRLETPYYHMIDEEDYRAFVWIKENVNESYEKAVLAPWKGSAFTGITEKNVYHRIVEYATPSDLKAYDFLSGGCKDTDFLRKNGISIVYTKGTVNNPDLTKVSENVYLLKEAGEPE